MSVQSFSITDVAELTGIPIETLRVWERRYGYPAPSRGERGRRTYDQHDITKLRLIQRAIHHGMRPGDLVTRQVSQLRQMVLAVASQEPLPEKLAAPLELLDLVTQQQLQMLERRLRELAKEQGPRSFVVNTAHPLALAVGDAWQQGKLAIHQEHMVSDLLSAELRALCRQHESHVAHPLILLGNLPHEPHQLPLELVATYLIGHGVRTRMLGLATPVDELVTAAKKLSADAVGISITAPPHRTSKEMVKELAAKLPKQCALWVGGAHAASIAPPGVRLIQEWTALDDALLALR